MTYGNEDKGRTVQEKCKRKPSLKRSIPETGLQTYRPNQNSCSELSLKWK